jgi:hypothetical protein
MMTVESICGIKPITLGIIHALCFNRMISIFFCDFNWAITVTNLLVNYLRNNE